MKILLLENDMCMSYNISKKLTSIGFLVDIFLDTSDALKSIDNGYSCFILRIHNDSSHKSLKFVKSIRDFHPNTPIILLHREDTLDIDVIKNAYKSGCDDFLKKPFFMDELEAKIHKLLNIRNDVTTLAPQCSFDFRIGMLSIGGMKKRFSKKEAKLFSVLLSKKDTVVSFETIKAIVWEGQHASLDSIRSLMRRLRQKIPFKCIETFVDTGYILKLDSIKHYNVITEKLYHPHNSISA